MLTDYYNLHRSLHITRLRVHKKVGVFIRLPIVQEIKFTVQEVLEGNLPVLTKIINQQVVLFLTESQYISLVEKLDADPSSYSVVDFGNSGDTLHDSNLALALEPTGIT